ncbi:MAG TPA: helix-turn-helix transcriptional regulator [Mucilaginibacter sp.]|jgi:transcriptional regulator with XRE-family HTH domain
MNRLLYVARKAKGWSVGQLAKVLEITEEDYNGLEHSLSDLSPKQALKLAKFYEIEPELFLYNDGRDKRLISFAMEEVSKIVNDLNSDGISQPLYFRVVTLGNTALTLQVELGHALYRQYELEKDNEAIRKLNKQLSAEIQGKTQNLLQ